MKYIDKINIVLKEIIIKWMNIITKYFEIESSDSYILIWLQWRELNALN